MTFNDHKLSWQNDQSHQIIKHYILMPLNKTSICESIKAAATVVAVSTVVPAVAAATT